MASEIDPNHDVPKNSDSVLEAWINDRPFTFRKTRKKGGVFLYTCEKKTGDAVSVTSFFSDRNLTPEELEAMPQFIAFVSATF